MSCLSRVARSMADVATSKVAIAIDGSRVSGVRQAQNRWIDRLGIRKGGVMYSWGQRRAHLNQHFGPTGRHATWSGFRQSVS